MTLWLHLLPCTSVELAAALNTTLHKANARLQRAKEMKLVRRTDIAIKPPTITRGRRPHLWERT